MTHIVCPFCGSRELAEFEFHKTLPNAGDVPFARTYLRIDSLEFSREHWQHVLGCRAWLEVHRNPSTGVVLATHLLGEAGS
ncbi:MAG TPA: sarcosine oxidase subunit delta [Steroidobacteraceae bacterium]